MCKFTWPLSSLHVACVLGLWVYIALERLLVSTGLCVWVYIASVEFTCMKSLCILWHSGQVMPHKASQLHSTECYRPLRTLKCIPDRTGSDTNSSWCFKVISPAPCVCFRVCVCVGYCSASVKYIGPSIKCFPAMFKYISPSGPNCLTKTPWGAVTNSKV